MFYTVILAAVRGQKKADVAAVAPLIPESAWREENGWLYWSGSIYVAQPSDIVNAVSKAPFPVLVAESRPFVTAVQIAGAKNKAEPLLWHWGHISPARVKALEEQYHATKDDMISRGDFKISKAAQKKAKDATFGEACRIIFEDQTTALAAAMSAAKFCDKAALEAALLKLTPAELEWTVGGFPRFADALGFSAIFPNFSKALAGEPLISTIDEVAPMRAALPEPVAIEGGPFKLALADLPAFAGMLALFNTEAKFGLRLTGAHAVDRAPFRGPTHHLFYTDDAIHFKCGGDDWRMRNSAPILAELAPAFRSADGGQLELVGLRLGLGAGGVRFSGTISKDSWLIEKSWPAVRSEALADMLVLGRAGRKEGPVVLRPNEEAEIPIKMKWNQRYFKNLVRNGNEWTTLPDASPEFLAQVVCGIRYGDFGAIAKPGAAR